MGRQSTVNSRQAGCTGLLALVLALLSSPVASAGPSVKVGSLDRTYRLHLPKDHDPKKPAPLVIVLHGGGGNVEQVAKTTRFDEVADAHGFIALYLQGTGRETRERVLGTWNGGTCCGQALENGVDDVAFARAAIDQVGKQVAVDPARIYATGISNGAQMALRLACELSDRLAGVAAVASPGLPPGCKPQRAVPALFVHGSADPCTTFEKAEKCGGCFSKAIEKAWGIPIPGKDHFPCDGALPQVDFFAKAQGCKAQEETFFEKGDAKCTRRTGCAKGGEAALCRIEGGGHTWPGGVACEDETRLCAAMKSTTGKMSQDLPASEAIWQFFSRHALPAATGAKGR